MLLGIPTGARWKEDGHPIAPRRSIERQAPK
jgi:hypothetical protein